MKKGLMLTTSALVGLILLLLSTIIILFIITRFNSENSCYQKQVCQASVALNAKARDPLTGKEQWPVNCPTRYIRFTQTGYDEETGDCQNQVEFKEEKDTISLQSCELENEDGCPYLQKVNEVIADKLYDCWSQFGAGRLQVFSNYDTDRQCAICSEIEFSSEVREKFGDTYASFIVPFELTLDNYMRTKGPPLRDITYYEYTEDLMDHFDKPYYDYSFYEDYVILFRATNEHYLRTRLDEFFELFDDRLPLINVDDDKKHFLNELLFIERDKVVDECDKLVAQ